MTPQTVDTITFSDPVSETEQTVTVTNRDDWDRGDPCPECGNATMTEFELSSEMAHADYGFAQGGHTHGRVEIQCNECETTLRQHPMAAVYHALPQEHWDSLPQLTHLDVTVNDNDVSLDHVNHSEWSQGDYCPVCEESVFFEVHLDMAFGTYDDDGIFHISGGGDRLATLYRECDACKTTISRHPLMDLYTELDSEQ